MDYIETKLAHDSQLKTFPVNLRGQGHILAIVGGAAVATRRARSAIQNAHERVSESRDKLRQIKGSAEEARPELERSAAELESMLDSVDSLLNTISEDRGNGAAVSRFVRRMLSREMIVTVVAIIAIWNGGDILGAEEAIAIAVASSGLVVSRGVVKQRSGGSDD